MRMIGKIFLDMMAPPSASVPLPSHQQARIVSDVLNTLYIDRLREYQGSTSQWVEVVDKPNKKPDTDLIEVLDEPVQAPPGIPRKQQLENIVRFAFGRKEKAIQSVVPGIRLDKDDMKIDFTRSREAIVAHLVPLLEEVENILSQHDAPAKSKMELLKAFSMAAGTISNGTRINGIGPGDPLYFKAAFSDAESRVRTR